jgi:hypothetical protein
VGGAKRNPPSAPQSQSPYRAEAKPTKQSGTGLSVAKALLFLKKKKQKNFHLLRVVALSLPRPAINESFLLLFFKKEALASLNASVCRARPIAAQHRLQIHELMQPVRPQLPPMP